MLHVEHLTRTYGHFKALDDLSIDVGAGELHGFVGPNGAGKTTTMRIIATLLPASGGRALVDGVDVTRAPRKARRLIGYMPDFFGVYDKLKASEYLDFYARCYAFGVRERGQMIDNLLDLVNLRDKRDAYVDTLSRGMKQRLCLARSLIHDPKLLLLDEPASGMDPRARAEMKSILRTLKDMGKTVFISSHILPELSEMCDSLTILDHGRLVFSGSVAALSDKMNGRAPISLKVLDCGQIDAALPILSEFPGVTGVDKTDEDALRVGFSQDDAQAARLLTALVAGGVSVTDYHRAPMDLEKVFMEVTDND